MSNSKCKSNFALKFRSKQNDWLKIDLENKSYNYLPCSELTFRHDFKCEFLLPLKPSKWRKKINIRTQEFPLFEYCSVKKLHHMKKKMFDTYTLLEHRVNK